MAQQGDRLPRHPGEDSGDITRRLRADKLLRTGLRQDFGTPISAIIGYAEMLLEEGAGPPPGDTFADDVGKITAAGRELQRFVDKLFAEKLQGGRMDPEVLGKNLRHELRTPLNHIIGYSEMLLEEVEDAGDAGRAADLKRIRSSGRILLGMVEDLLRNTAATPAGGETELAGSHLSSTAREVAAGVASSMADLTEEEQTDEALRGRLLVVDDNEINRDMLARRLERHGHTVETAPDGQTALDMLAASDFDLLLLDIMMPGLNGYQVLERVKRAERTRHIPVIMVTALEELDSTVLCIKMGAEDYLPKPFNPTLLKARVEACLDKKRLRDREVQHLAAIEEQRARADALLHVILPDAVVTELTQTNAVRPRRFEDVAVMFADIVGFTPYCERHEPEEIVTNLQALVVSQEDAALRHGLQKIKTIGDSFMAAGNLLDPHDDPVGASVRCGLEMIAACEALDTGWPVRVGIHVGPVVAGVFGHRQYLYDLVGDTVNTAARMESNGIPGAVTLSGVAWRRLEDRAEGQSLGTVDVKGKGKLEMVRFARFTKPGGEV